MKPSSKSLVSGAFNGSIEDRHSATYAALPYIVENTCDVEVLNNTHDSFVAEAASSSSHCHETPIVSRSLYSWPRPPKLQRSNLTGDDTNQDSAVTTWPAFSRLLYLFTRQGSLQHTPCLDIVGR